MGDVYRAHDTRLDRDVALKVLPDASRLDPAALQRFEREARLLAALNHPNIATLHGVEAVGDVQSWSPDGAHMAYWTYERGVHQWVLPLTGGGVPKQLLDESVEVLRGPQGTAASYDGHSQISPDGRWLAYMSTLTGRPEVYVRAFPAGEGARQVSTNGGVTPRWRLDGQELYYMTGYDHGTMMAVPVETDGTALTFDAPDPLFPIDMAIVPHSTLVPNFHTYAVTRDGQRFVLPLPVSTLRSGSASAAITVVLNWSTLLGD